MQRSTMTMPSARLQEAGGMLLLGLGLCGVAFLAPDSGHHFGEFFQLATQTTWLNPFQTMAVWCSFKIILLSIGLLFALDSIGLVLWRTGRKNLAVAIFSMHLLNLLVFLAGCFYFIKALL